MSLDFKGQGQARDRNLGVLQSPNWTRSPGARVWSEERGVLGPGSSVESETSIETDREWSEGEEKSQASECSGR